MLLTCIVCRSEQNEGWAARNLGKQGLAGSGQVQLRSDARQASEARTAESLDQVSEGGVLTKHCGDESEEGRDREEAHREDRQSVVRS